jgi:hypothetical protein
MEAELRINGKIAFLRRARKQHRCKNCPLPIARGQFYYEVTYGGSGLGSIKFPIRVHYGHCLQEEIGDLA